MTTGDLLTKLKTTSLWVVSKSLPFDEGPSSTRVVYMSTALTVLLCLFVSTVAFCWVYIRDPQHTASVIVAGLIGTLSTSAFAFATNSQNLRHQLRAQEGSSVSTIADTPVSTEAVSVEENPPAPETK